MIAAAIPIWLILLTAVVFVLVLFGGGGAHAMRKFLLFILTAGAVLAVLALVIYPFRQSHHNVYTPAIEVPLPYDSATVTLDGTTMQAIASDGTTAVVQVDGPSTTSDGMARAKILLVILPALAALAAFAAVRRSHGAVPRHGNGLLWVAAGGAALVLLGFLFTGKVDRGLPVVQGINTYPEPLLAPAASSDRALIEEQWERLTGPRIALDEPPAPPTAQKELQGAAETLQAASEKMAQTASQGWLYAATKTFLDAQPKHPVSKTSAQPPSAASTSPSAVRSARPDWVVRPPGIVGNVRKVVVSAGPFKTLDECHVELEQRMRAVVAQRIAELASAAAGVAVSKPHLESLNLGTDYILRELCTEEYVEEVDTGVGPMKNAYALMEFTEPQGAALVDRWKTYARRDRLAVASLGALLVVGSLSLAYGLLKVDTWTRGYYSKRLFIGVPAAIIALVALLAMEISR